MFNEAIEYAYMAASTWKSFKAVTANPQKCNSLMLPLGDNDGWWHITDERFRDYWNTTINRLMSVEQIKGSKDFENLKNMFA